MTDSLPAVTQEPARRFMTTVSNNPAMDTAAFEHIGRFANVMAASGMMSKSLIEDSKGNLLPFETVYARAFLIAEQASRWNQSPMAIRGSAFFVHGRLGWEGKLVSAMLAEVHGIEVDYEFGTWDVKLGKIIFPDDGEEEPGESDLLAVRIYERGSDRNRRYVEGYAGLWKTTGQGSPWRPGAFKRQMRYRGVREWARAYRASAILGIVTNDEPFDEAVDVTPQIAQPRVKRLSAKLLNADGEPLGGGFDAGHVARELAPDDDSAALANAVAESNADDAKVEPVEETPAVETKPETPAATDPQADAAEATAAAGSADNSKGDAASNGEKDGSGQTATTTASPSEEIIPEEHVAPVERVEKAAPKGPFAWFWKEFAGLTWADKKVQLSALYKSDDWQAMEDENQADIRRKIWPLLTDQERANYLSEPTAFRLWCDTQSGAEGADAVEAAFRTMQQSNKFDMLPNASKGALANTVNIILARMRA